MSDVTLLLEDVGSPTNHREYIEQARYEKRKKYIQTREEIVYPLYTLVTITSSRENIYEWYNTWYDYSCMGFVTEKHFWMAMRKLEYHLAEWNTVLHSRMFSVFSGGKGRITAIEFILAVIVLRNEAPQLIPRKKLFDDLFKSVTESDMHQLYHQLPDQKLAFVQIDDAVYSLQKDTILHLYKSVCTSKPISSHPHAKLFYAFLEFN